MGLVHGLGQDPRVRPEWAKVPSRTYAVAAPRGVAALEPVPLDLLAGGVVDLDALPALDPGARLAVRAQAGQAQLAGEARIRAGVAEGHHLVEQRRGPQVGVVDEAGGHVGGERLQRVGPGRAPDAGPVTLPFT